MKKASNAPTAAVTFDPGEVTPDTETPSYPPLVPAEIVLDYLDGCATRMSKMLERGKSDDEVLRWYHDQIASQIIDGPFSHLQYQRLTLRSVAIVESDYGVEAPSPANLWVQPGFDPQVSPEAVVMTLFDGATRRLSVAASADQDFVLIHRRSGRPCCRFNTVDVIEGEGRVIGDGKTFASYMPIAPLEMPGRVSLWHRACGLPYKGTSGALRGPVRSRRPLGPLPG